MGISLLIVKFAKEGEYNASDLWNYQPKKDIIAAVLGVDKQSCASFLKRIKYHTNGSEYFLLENLKKVILVLDLQSLVLDYVEYNMNVYDVMEDDCYEDPHFYSSGAKYFILHRSQVVSLCGINMLALDHDQYEIDSFEGVGEATINMGLSKWYQETLEEWVTVYIW